MFFASTLPSSTPIWSAKEHNISYHGTSLEGTEQLTERVDAPDDTLREDLVFVEHNEGAERLRVEDREDDAVARPVALKDLRLDQRLRGVRAELLRAQ